MRTSRAIKSATDIHHQGTCHATAVAADADDEEEEEEGSVQVGSHYRHHSSTIAVRVSYSTVRALLYQYLASSGKEL